jgi:hypothetical protein
MHPDHLELLCFAAAVALVVDGEKWPRVAYGAALVLVTPVAFACKLSGAGIGVGLLVIALLERRWRALLLLAGSGVLALATVPLFQATLGRFTFYAIGVQASHPIVWARLGWLVATPAGVLLVACVALHGWLAASEATATRLGADARVAVLTAAVTLASLPAYLKYAGRDNNLALLIVGATVALFLRGARHADDARTARAHPALFGAVALVATLLFRPIAALPTRAEREAAVADADTVVHAVQDGDASSKKTLLLLHTYAWIRAGHRDVPHDRYHSAIELFYGRHPEGDLLFAHVEDGRYDTIVATASALRGGDDPRGDFASRLRDSIERRYELVFPEGAKLDSAEGVVIFEKRGRD